MKDNKEEEQWLRDRLIGASVVRFMVFIICLGVPVAVIYSAVFVTHQVEEMLAVSPLLLFLIGLSIMAFMSFISRKQPPEGGIEI